MASPLSLLLALALALQAGGIMIEYNVTLSCGDIPWCYSMLMLEHDPQHNDTIGTKDESCVYTHFENTQLKGYGPSDGPFDNVVEVVAVITHNCTTDGSYHNTEIPEELFNVKNEHDHHYHFDIKLDDAPMG